LPALVTAILSFGLGIIFVKAPLQPPSLILWTAAAIIVAIYSTLLICKKRVPTCIVLAAFCLCGIAHAKSFTSPGLPPHHLLNIMMEKQEISLTFRLTGKPTSQNGKTKIYAEAESLLPAQKAHPIAAKGLALLTVNAPSLPGLIPGEYYQARCRLSLPRRTGTPGAFDYPGYLAAKDIAMTGWVANPDLIQPLSSTLHPRSRLPDIFTFEKLRMRTESLIDSTLDPEWAPMYRALLIGDRTGVNNKVLEDFKATGLMHLLAISGMHLGVLAFLLNLLFIQATKNIQTIYLTVPAHKIGLASSLPILFLYTGLAGFQPPVSRSCIMATVFIIAVLGNRQWCSLTNIAIAAGIILIENPLSIFTASFQLSFAATTAIVLFSQHLRTWYTFKDDAGYVLKMRNYLLMSLLISTAAFIATAPFSLFHFNRISFLSPLSTLLVSPLLCLWTLPLGLTALIISPLSHGAAALVLNAGAVGINLSQKIASLLAAVPHASLYLPTPPPYMVAVACILTFFSFRTKNLRIMTACLLGSAFLLSGYPLTIFNQENTAVISFLDVGRGSASVLELPGRHVTLLDGGGPDNDYSDVGETIIAPFLWHRQIRKLDQIILTHPHADHFNGLGFILKKFAPKILWVSETQADSPEFMALLEEARMNGCQVRVAKQGDILTTGQKNQNGFMIQCLENLAEKQKKLIPSLSSAKKNPNNRGLILRFTHGSNRFLFPGDIEQEFEKQLTDEESDLGAEVLLAPHHGLASSGSTEFMKAVSAGFIVISNGKNDLSQQEQEDKNEAHRLMTSHHGSIFMTSDGKKITVKTFYGLDGLQENSGKNLRRDQTSVKSVGGFLRN